MHCKSCNARDGFATTVDRIIHVSGNHIGRVVDNDGYDYQFDTHKKIWVGK